MKDILGEIKRRVVFHQEWVNALIFNKEMQSYHKGAIMAFSKCLTLLDRWPHNNPLNSEREKAEPVRKARNKSTR